MVSSGSSCGTDSSLKFPFHRPERYHGPERYPHWSQVTLAAISDLKRASFLLHETSINRIELSQLTRTCNQNACKSILSHLHCPC